MRKLIDKISAWLVGFGIEFYLHIVCVMFVAMIVARVCNLTGAERPLAAVIGAIAGLVVGFFKEFIDAKTTHVIEPKDYVADLIGAVFFVLCFI